MSFFSDMGKALGHAAKWVEHEATDPAARVQALLVAEELVKLMKLFPDNTLIYKAGVKVEGVEQKIVGSAG